MAQILETWSIAMKVEKRFESFPIIASVYLLIDLDHPSSPGCQASLILELEISLAVIQGQTHW